MCLKLIAIWVLFVAINITLVMVTQPKQRQIINIFWSFLSFGWLIAIPLLLMYICYGIYLLDLDIINKIHDIHDSGAIRKNRILTVERLRDSVNACLGLFPFLLFCELFSTTCLRITHVIIN